MTQPNTLFDLNGLSLAQARVLRDSLELYSRIHLGQLEAVEEVFRFEGNLERSDQARAQHLVNCKQAVGHLQAAKQLLLNLAPYQSRGLGCHAPESANIAFDLMRVVRHRLAWEQHPEGGTQLQFDDPYLTTYSLEPRVTMSSNSPHCVVPTSESSEPQSSAHQRAALSQVIAKPKRKRRI